MVAIDVTAVNATVDLIKGKDIRNAARAMPQTALMGVRVFGETFLLHPQDLALQPQSHAPDGVDGGSCRQGDFPPPSQGLALQPQSHAPDGVDGGSCLRGDFRPPSPRPCVKLSKLGKTGGLWGFAAWHRKQGPVQAYRLI
jgi:hypothetical protein